MSRSARLGAFILVTVAILLLGIFIIGSKRYLFTPTYTLRTKFANVAGLSAGADVRVGGVHVGTVRQIELPRTAGDGVTVSLELDTTTHTIVKKDSAASIETEGLLGNQYMAVSFGSAGQPDVKDGDTIASLPPLELAALFTKANSLLDTSGVAMNNISKATASLQSVTAKIDHGDGTVGALVNDRDIYNDLKKTTASAQGVATAAQAGAVSFQENMEALKHNFLLRGYFKSRGYEDSTEIGQDDVESLPSAAALKEISIETKDIFTKQDAAQLKNQKKLKEAGELLAKGDFGVAVVVVSAGQTGDAESELKLAQARAMVVRSYLVDHYSFDDTKVKTIAMGKQNDASSKGGWGVVKIMIYPAGTPVPETKEKTGAAPADKSSK